MNDDKFLLRAAAIAVVGFFIFSVLVFVGVL